MLLAGCGGRHVLQALPGVASLKSAGKPTSIGKLVPAVADPIPDNVLAQPILGEGWRFDGPVAPPGWMLAKGQSFKVAENPRLFSILGNSAGPDASGSFHLPNTSFGYVIAVAGFYPTSPAMLAQSARRISSRQNSLGPNATPRMLIAKRNDRREAAIAGARKLMTSAVRASSIGYVLVTAEMAARFTESRFSARDVAFGALTPSNRNALEAGLERIARGQSSLNDVIVQMTPLLNGLETAALLDANDARLLAFRPQWSGAQHANPQYEAARFLISVGLSREQLRRYIALQQ
ncbi:MAG TPA: phage tail protein [Candidatus Elarobacter sp.]